MPLDPKLSVNLSVGFCNFVFVKMFENCLKVQLEVWGDTITFDEQRTNQKIKTFLNHLQSVLINNCSYK